MDLDAVLAACNSNDNNVRKQAEQTITMAAKSPEILSQLMQRLQYAEQPQVCRLAQALYMPVLCVKQQPGQLLGHAVTSLPYM